jgi:hypothetical protein
MSNIHCSGIRTLDLANSRFRCTRLCLSCSSEVKELQSETILYQTSEKTTDHRKPEKQQHKQQKIGKASVIKITAPFYARESIYQSVLGRK